MQVPYIKLFADASATIDMLSDAEAGRLLKSLMHYANDQEDELPGQEKLVFAMLKTQIDRDAASYRTFCDKQRENGLKGGRPKKPMVITENPNNPVVFSETQKSQDKEEDKEKEEDVLKENNLSVVKEKRRRFSPPSLDDVRAYCKERRNNVDPQRFIDFYASKGWVVGKSPMRDWKAAVRTWEQRDSSPSQPTRQVTAQQYTQRTYTEEELENRSSTDDILAEAAGL